MKKVSIKEPFNLIVEEVDIPKLKDNDVLIKTKVCGICGTDVHCYHGETIFGKVFPFNVGHEVSGVVEKVGAKCSTVSIGDRVVINPLFPCGECEFCLEGLQNHCINLKTIGLVGPGGFSDYIVVPGTNVHRIDNMSFTDAAFTEPLATVAYGVNKVRHGLGHKVLINGAGPIGLMHLQLVRQLGYSLIVIRDLNTDKLKKAKRLGADETIIVNADGAEERLKKISGTGFDLIIDCTGVPKSIEDTIPLLRRRGQLLLFGVCPLNSSIQINPFEIFRRDIEIIGSFSLNGESFQKSVELLKANKINTTELIADLVPRQKLIESIELIKQGKVNGKILVNTEL